MNKENGLLSKVHSLGKNTATGNFFNHAAVAHPKEFSKEHSNKSDRLADKGFLRSRSNQSIQPQQWHCSVAVSRPGTIRNCWRERFPELQWYKSSLEIAQNLDIVSDTPRKSIACLLCLVYLIWTVFFIYFPCNLTFHLHCFYLLSK